MSAVISRRLHKIIYTLNYSNLRHSINFLQVLVPFSIIVNDAGFPFLLIKIRDTLIINAIQQLYDHLIAFVAFN